VQAIVDNPLLAAGESVRGHEFHWSSFQTKTEKSKISPEFASAYKVLEQGGKLEGFRFKNVLASYIHLHFGSKKNLAPRFVQACLRRAGMNQGLS
jgi:cobyrinic acid a,c-diamide synthase